MSSLAKDSGGFSPASTANIFYVHGALKMAFQLLAFRNAVEMVSRLRADFLSSQKVLAAILLQKKSIMQVLAANILMRLSIVRIVCECFAMTGKSTQNT